MTRTPNDAPRTATRRTLPPKTIPPCFGGLVSFALAAALAFSGAPAHADLDAVFVLDTTGSMSGEIREVRERVRQLAAAALEVRRGERVRFGLVAFRDRGDDYVTRVSPLDADLGVSQRFLDSLAAAGGGDGPESVVKAVEVALRDLWWDPSARTERHLYLIGDAPPHLDYEGEPDLEALAERAREVGVVVHAIGCRSLPQSGIRWFRELAYATEGTYQHIGRVRGPEAPTLTDAVRRTVAAGAVAERPVPAVWRGRREEPVEGLLVRQGGPPSSGQAGSGAADDDCVLEIRLPEGLALQDDPVATDVGGRLRVELDLGSDPSAASGVDWWDLESCPPTPRPVEVRIRRGAA